MPTFNQIMRKPRRVARAKTKSPAMTFGFNTLKNQGYHLEHNFGLGEEYLSLTFFSLMMLAFLCVQTHKKAYVVPTVMWRSSSKFPLSHDTGGG